MNKALIPLLCTATALTLRAAELYSTDFSAFTTGSGKLTTSDAWALSSTHAAYTWLHGIDAESTHAVLGLGNAAYFGGTGQTMTFTSVTASQRFPFVQRSYTFDPVTTSNEIVTVAMLAGVLDSSTTSPVRRDDFEIYISNTSAAILGAIQFDNSSVVTGATGGNVLRRSWSTSANAFQYIDTGVDFTHGIMHDLIMRINYRTNRWSAWLDDVPLFSDITFYSGTANRNLGRVGIGMNVTNFTQNTVTPGDNFMLFDNVLVSADPLPVPTLSILLNPSRQPVLNWQGEAGYRYQVSYSTTTSGWLTTLPNSLIAPTETGNITYIDTTSTGAATRFYRVTAMYP